MGRGRIQNRARRVSCPRVRNDYLLADADAYEAQRDQRMVRAGQLLLTRGEGSHCRRTRLVNGDSAKLPYCSHNPVHVVFTRRPNEAARMLGSILEATLRDSRSKNMPSHWPPTSTSGCQLSLHPVDESLQFKRPPYFEFLPPLILLVWRRR